MGERGRVAPASSSSARFGPMGFADGIVVYEIEPGDSNRAPGRLSGISQLPSRRRLTVPQGSVNFYVLIIYGPSRGMKMGLETRVGVSTGPPRI